MLSPALARWITETFDRVDAFSAERLGLVHAKDPSIFDAARRAGAVVLTKDSDFVDEVGRAGAPPVIWVRVGNTRTASMKRVLTAHLPAALEAIRAGATWTEIGET